MAKIKSDADADAYQSADDVVVCDGKNLFPDTVISNPFLSRMGTPASTAAVPDATLFPPLPATSNAAVLTTSVLPASSSLSSDAAVPSMSALPVTDTSISSGNAAVPSTGVTQSASSYANVIASTHAATSVKPKVRHFQPNNAHLKSWMSRAVSFKASHKNTTLNDYLKAISASVPADQITDSARISGTVQVYFKNASWSQQLIASGLDFRGTHIDVLPVIVAPKRITVSNIPPYFQDSDLRTLMSDFGQVQGRVERLPASVDPAVFGAVNSFRRVVSIQFATEDDFDKLPASVDCFLGPKKFTFYLNNPFKCHLCKELGHQQHDCPNMTAPIRQSFENTTISANVTNASISQAEHITEIVPATENETIETMDLNGDNDSSGGFKKPKKRKNRKRQSQVPANVATDAPPVKMSPVRRSPVSANQYSYEPETNTWKDGEGCFTPIVDLSALINFTTAALQGTALDKRRLIEDIVKDSDGASALSRQVTVLAYTDPDIAAVVDPKARHRTRMRYAYIAKEIRRLYSFPHDTDLESDAKNDSQN